MLNKSLLATAGMLLAFLLGAPIPLAALGAASFVLITRRVKAERIFRGVDWSLLIFLAACLSLRARWKQAV